MKAGPVSGSATQPSGRFILRKSQVPLGLHSCLRKGSRVYLEGSGDSLAYIIKQPDGTTLRAHKSKLSPTPYPSGKGAPLDDDTTAWSQADAFADYVNSQGDIPRSASGQAQRARIQAIVDADRQVGAASSDVEKEAARKHLYGAIRVAMDAGDLQKAGNAAT